MVVVSKSEENVQQTSKWVGCFICQGPHRAKDCPKREKVPTLQLNIDSETGNLEIGLNLIRMVNIIHKSNSIFELMYMAIQVNEIRVNALVNTGATHTCVASSVVAAFRLTIEAYDSVVSSLNGRDHWVEDIIRFYPLEMGEWVGCCDLIVMHLRDFKMIIMMDFLIQAEVSIMPYLRTLTFMEKGMSCIVMVVGDHAIKTENGARLDSSTKHSRD